MRERGKERLCLNFYLFVKLLNFAQERAAELLQEWEVRAQRAEEASLELLHRATSSNYNRSAADLRSSQMRYLLLEELRFPVVATRHLLQREMLEKRRRRKRSRNCSHCR
jgi:hypothetical protein